MSIGRVWLVVAGMWVIALSACDTSVPTPATDRNIPTARDQELVRKLLGFALAPGPNTVTGVPWGDEVWLGLSNRLLAGRHPEELASPEEWLLEADRFRDRVGPFSALELLAEADQTTISVGPHRRCASPPVPPPDEVAGLRQISIQPLGISSCLQWWAVDLFVTTDGEVAAVTLDLSEP